MGPFDSTIQQVYMIEWYRCMAYARVLYIWGGGLFRGNGGLINICFLGVEFLLCIIEIFIGLLF